MGAIDNGRNNEIQAIVALMGRIENIFGKKISDILQLPLFKDLLTILGCGIGKDFDINKLKFDKIIIMTDSDIDGSAIKSSVLLFFYLFLPEIITQGKLYIALPPLYLLDNKTLKKYKLKEPWLFDRKEAQALFSNIIADNVKLAMSDEDGGSVYELKKKEIVKWVDMNAEYLVTLNNLQNRSGCDIPELLEYVCYYKILTLNDDQKFKKLIEKKFPEVKYDMNDYSIYGSHEAKNVSLIVDELFMKMASRTIKLIAENPAYHIHYKIKTSDEDYKEVTIGEFLSLMEKMFAISFHSRFKGLGEANPEILFLTTLNPKNRRLLRLNMTDAQEAMDMFKLLHEKSKDGIIGRKEMLENTVISFLDIDN